jgi:thiol-disulfide isomerase/thioredoxin
MLELKEDNLAQTMELKTVVLYGAPWCGNCRLLKPKFKKLSSETDGVQFVYVNAIPCLGRREQLAYDSRL